MSLVINTNIDSINAQNSLSGSQALLSQSLERLSSGLRINSAADDAAGLAISQGFTTQVNGDNQAINNANDAVSEAQTAGGALNAVVNNLQSIRTLAVEAANGSNSTSDRAALNQQVQQQISEITQIAQQTSFNGLAVLNGTGGVSAFQVGADVGDTISIDLSQGVAANQIGQVASGSGTVTSSALAGNLTLAVGAGAAVTVGASSATVGTGPGQGADSAYAKAAAINAANISGLTATATNTATETTAFSNLVAGTTAGTYSLSINNVTVYGGASNVAANSTLTASDVAAQINQFSTEDGNVVASVNNGKLSLTASDGSDIAVSQTWTAGAGGSGSGVDTSISGGDAGAGKTNYGTVTLAADSTITIGGGSDAAAIGQTVGTPITLNAGSTLSTQNVLTQGAANATILAVDSALATVSQFQSQLGAIQNRFTSAVSNLQSTSQNLTQSRSTIEDADFAQETANLTQAQVLEQAGISVLAQANQQPQLVLKLLQ
jgi:flagellin